MKKISSPLTIDSAHRIVNKIIDKWSKNTNLADELEDWLVDTSGPEEGQLSQDSINALNNILDNYDLLGENNKMKLTKEQRNKVKTFAKKLVEKKNIMKESRLEIQTLADELAEKCKWTGKDIAKVFMEALTTANFHDEKRELIPIMKKLFGINSIA